MVATLPLCSAALPSVMACVIMLVPISDWRNSVCRLTLLRRWLHGTGAGQCAFEGLYMLMCPTIRGVSTAGPLLQPCSPKGGFQLLTALRCGCMRVTGMQVRLALRQPGALSKACVHAPVGAVEMKAHLTSA